MGVTLVINYPPTNMSVPEDSDVSVPCKFIGTNISPNWIISNRIFTPSFLPPKHYYNGSALNIRGLSRDRTYRCFLRFRDGTNLTSNITTITVVSKSEILAMYCYMILILSQGVPNLGQQLHQ